MSASIAQIVQSGAQGMLLHGDPLTPFKSSIQRPLPFATEPRIQSFDTGNIDYGNVITKTAQYDADLILRAHIVISIDATEVNSNTVSASGASRIQQTEDLGHAMIKNCSFQVGSVKHQEWNGDVLHCLDSISLPSEQMHEEMTGRTCDGSGHTNTLQERPYQKQMFWVHIPAWFAPERSGHPKQKDKYDNALALVACQLSEPKFVLELRSKSELFKYCNDGDSSHFSIDGTASPVCPLKKVEIHVEYAFIDDSSRNIFAKMDHFHLIIQYQHKTKSVASTDTSISFRPNLNHCVRDLLWFYRSKSSETALEWFNFAGNEVSTSEFGVYNGDAFKSVEMLYNNNTRVEKMPPQYFRMVQPRMNYTRIPNEFIYTYAFSLQPEESATTPLGGINMSRIDNFTLEFETTSGFPDSGNIHIWAFNYNLVLIKNGTGHLSFAS